MVSKTKTSVQDIKSMERVRDNIQQLLMMINQLVVIFKQQIKLLTLKQFVPIRIKAPQSWFNLCYCLSWIDKISHRHLIQSIFLIFCICIRRYLRLRISDNFYNNCSYLGYKTIMCGTKNAKWKFPKVSFRYLYLGPSCIHCRVTTASCQRLLVKTFTY